MIKKVVQIIFMLLCWHTYAQQEPTVTTKKMAVAQDTLIIYTTSIPTEKFELTDKKGLAIDSLLYKVDFKKGILVWKQRPKNIDTILVKHSVYPTFVTKTYTKFENAIVVPNGKGTLYSLDTPKPNMFKPFDGLNTSGSITRGVTVGNNQNATVNSNLDLQITGKISDKVGIRASIQDSNIPLQNNGYSQKIDEFDQIFIELFSDKWNIRAGDLFLENRKSRFMNFNKKVQGLSTKVTLGTPDKSTEIYASGAVVRGQYAKSSFTGQEGNQGPYKLKGNNGELYVLVISGSEQVYVNGIVLKRGENNDYVIDYNAGEIKFTSLFPINSEMRIVVEYQYSDRNFTRFVSYGGTIYKQKKWSVGGYWYNENDVKNQPLQQNLSQEQIAILQNAGDNPNSMFALSAYQDTYSENKILYKKHTIGSTIIYEFSTDATQILYNVRFTWVGNNMGNYIVSNTSAIGKIYQYVAPIAGIPQGNYEPTIKLIAPTKLQIATVTSKINLDEKTDIDFELGVSNNDLNLYSTLDDTNNKGLAGVLQSKQRLFTGKHNWNTFATVQFVQKNFKTIERLYAIEFNRDWNVATFTGNQSLIKTGLQLDLKEKGNVNYQVESLADSGSFSGIKHTITAHVTSSKWLIQSDNSYLNSRSEINKSSFLRTRTKVNYHFYKNWTGATYKTENNKLIFNTTNEILQPSQRFSELGTHLGRGDSTKVFVETGYKYRVNDSLQMGILKRVNTSHNGYIKSKLIQNQKTNLSAYINYRTLYYPQNSKPTEPSLNSRILYNDTFFNQKIQISTSYENQSGSIAQQEFTYIEVPPSQGVYMWNDYNNNGIQELQEFEVAPFPDLAKYVRIFLPNQVFIKTHQNKFSQALVCNPAGWNTSNGVKKFLSHFYNQTNFSLDRKIKKQQDNFDLNPFSTATENLLGLNTSFRNSLFYNKGKQHHTTTYTYTNNHIKSLLNSGSLENNLKSHQLQYVHLIQKTWQLSNVFVYSNTLSFSDTYASRNYELKNYGLEPKVSYLFSNNASVSCFYSFKNKQNSIGNLETLQQNQWGVICNYLSEKQFTLNAEYAFYTNKFSGNALSPVGFTMLEGLQSGKNATWRLLLQKKLTQYLDININYLGRKSENSTAIHTGTIQLRAYF
ncbi:hypothetical protein [Flavobacterium croceum]|uniref:hypothetical protein n=1 Tax=Flavobacterium croceum TaxID=370975 RepID=UPI0024A96B77|nr:hypothetical protein [Flavobacterium croceum]